MKHESESTSSKSSTKNSLDDNCCSGSINSPLSCKFTAAAKPPLSVINNSNRSLCSYAFTVYTTQDLDKDNECLPSGGKTTKIPLTILPSPHSQYQMGHQAAQPQQHQTQLPTHITTIEPCIHGEGHSIETFLGGGSIPTGTTTICNIVAHEYETSPGVATAGLCNFNTKTRCYEVMGQQHHSTSSGLPVENPSILATSAVPPVSSGVIGQFDWHQQQHQPQSSIVVGMVPCSSMGSAAFTVQSGTSPTAMCYVTQPQQQETNEFVGVGGLDILQGVGQGNLFIMLFVVFV